MLSIFIVIQQRQRCTYSGVLKDSKYQYIITIGTNYRKLAVGSLSYTIYIGKRISGISHHMNIQIRLAVGTSSIQLITIAGILNKILLRRNTRLIPFDITNIE